jgi:hypothetical protein
MAVNGVASFNNLIINAVGSYTLRATDGLLSGATSSSFNIALPPKVLSINRLSPVDAATEAASVTYAVTFSEPVIGVVPSVFQLVLAGTTASSTVVISPSGSYNSVYNVTVNNISGTGTVGLNLVDDGSILDQVGSHMANACNTFLGQRTYPAGSYANCVAVADVNADDKPDALVATDSGVNVLLGNGDGTFQAQERYPAGSYPGSVRVADMNGDGKLDLVVSSYSVSTSISILLGNGNGTFQTAKSIDVGVNTGCVRVADVNGDGKQDLVFGYDNGNVVGILLGNGDATFQAPKTVATTHNPGYVGVADINGDGKPDLIVAYGSGRGAYSNVGVMLGNGNGTVQAQKTFATGTFPGTVAVADLNGDGKMDLAVNNDGSYNVSVLLGKGDGTFQTQHTFPTSSAGPFDLVAADINGDRKTDLVVIGAYADMLMGNGDGTFQTRKSFKTGADTQSVAVADLNGDGKPDLTTANIMDSTISVLLNNFDLSGQLYSIDQPTQLTFTQSPTGATAGKVINPGTGIQVIVQDSSGATVGIDSSVVTLTLNGGTFAGGGTTAATTAANGVATFNNLIINAAGNYTLTAGDGALTGATSGSFTVYPLGDVNHDSAVNAADIDQIYANCGSACTSQWKLCQDGNPVGQADVDYLVKTILQTGYADANLDCKVDFTDFQVLLDHWQLKTQGWAGGDWNGDGVTDFVDFQALLDNWNPNGFGAVSQSDSASMSSAAVSTAAAVQVASTTVAAPSAGLPAVAAAGVSTASASVSAPLDASINLLEQGVTVASAPMQATSLSFTRSAVRQRRHSAVLVQNDNADTVDLLTQLIKPVVG